LRPDDAVCNVGDVETYVLSASADRRLYRTGEKNWKINYGRCNSFLGLNAMFCSSKSNVYISNICGGVVNVAVDQYAERKVEEHQMPVADFLRELLFVRDDHLVLSNNVDFNREKLHALIDYNCTN